MSGFIVALRCGNCGEPLGGLSTDVVWVCAPCGAAWEAETSDGVARLVRRPCFLLEPPPGAVAAARVAWLPFWRVELDAQAETGSAEGGVRRPDPRALDAVTHAALNRVWVRAFWMRNGYHAGDPGLVLTDARFPEVRIERGPFPVVTGIAIGSADALRMAELVVLRIADRTRDVAGVRLRTNGATVHLALIPFCDLGESLVCPATGRANSRALFEDLPPPPPAPL